MLASVLPHRNDGFRRTSAAQCRAGGPCTSAPSRADSAASGTATGWSHRLLADSFCQALTHAGDHGRGSEWAGRPLIGGCPPKHAGRSQPPATMSLRLPGGTGPLHRTCTDKGVSPCNSSIAVSRHRCKSFQRLPPADARWQVRRQHRSSAVCHRGVMLNTAQNRGAGGRSRPPPLSVHCCRTAASVESGGNGTCSCGATAQLRARPARGNVDVGIGLAAQE